MSQSTEFVDGVTVIRSAWLNAINQAVIAVRTKAGDYALINADGLVYFSTIGAARTATLPPAPADGQLHAIKKVGGSSNQLTVSGNGNNIEGSASDLTTGSTTTNVTFYLRYSSDPNSLGWWLL